MISSSTSQKWLTIFAECAVLMYWLSRVWSRQGYSSAPLCQTEVQRCLVWLHSLFDQAVSGIQIFFPLLSPSFLVAVTLVKIPLVCTMVFLCYSSYISTTWHPWPLLQSSNNIFFFYFYSLIESNESSLWPHSPFSVCCLISTPV